MGIRITVSGQEIVNDIGPCVIVANHQDNLDLFVLGHVVPKRCVSMGKKSLKYIPFFGQLYWLSGNVLIDRGNQTSARESMRATTHAMKDEKMKIWVFAEGTRNKGKNLLPFKKGAFRMAIDAGVPIVPVCANSYLGNMTLNKWHGGRIEIQVLEPIPTEGMTMDDVGRVLSETQSRMQQCIDRLDGKVTVKEES